METNLRSPQMYGSIDSVRYERNEQPLRLIPGTESTSPSRAREILIKPLDHGYSVTVGCQTVAIESSAKLIEKLAIYLNNPQEVENLYNQKKFL